MNTCPIPTTEPAPAHRHGGVLPGHPARDAAPVHVHGDALAQADVLKVAGVVAEDLLGPAGGD